MRLALYHPEITQNTGTLMRLGACLKVPLDIIEPCGFVLSDRRMLRAGMDYVELAYIERHVSWESYFEKRTAENRRLILLDPGAKTALYAFEFEAQDTLIVGEG